MDKILLRLVLVVLFIIHYGSSQNEGLTEAELRESPMSAEDLTIFLDVPSETVPPLNPDDGVVNPGKARSLPSIPFINPAFFYNPFEAFNPVQAGAFDAVVDRFRTDLEIAKQRQNVMLKYVECSSPKASECKPVLARDESDEPLRSLRGYWEWLQTVNPPAPGTVTCPSCPTQSEMEGAPKGYWEWLQSVNPTPPGSVPCSCPPPKGKEGPAPGTEPPLRYYQAPTYWDWLLSVNRPAADVVQADKFYAVMVAFKESIERLTVRQNVLYEYVSCSCPSTTECGAALKPVLDLMFTNNQNVTGEMIKDLVTRRRSSFIDTLFGWIPNFTGWISFNPLSVLADLLKPTYDGGSSYSTSSGQGGVYTVSSSGKPSSEHYVVHHPGGGTSHVSTSTGPGASSVSVVTTDQKKETDERSVDNKTSEKATHEVKKESHESRVEKQKESPVSRAEEKNECHGAYVEDANPGEYQGAIVSGHTANGPQEQGLSNIPKVVQSSLENKTPDGVQLSGNQVAPKPLDVPDANVPGVRAARQLLFGGGPGMVYPAFANRVPAQYTGVSPSASAGFSPASRRRASASTRASPLPSTPPAERRFHLNDFL